MRWLILGVFLLAFTPIHQEYETKEKIKAEFKNVELEKQDVSHQVRITTPTLTDMEDGEIRVISTGTLQFLIWRANQEIYAVQGSCITVFR